MKTYLVKIAKINTRGKVWCQPQLKEKGFFSFLCSWKSLSLLLIEKNTTTSDFKVWHEDMKEMYDSLNKFASDFNVKLEHQ